MSWERDPLWAKARLYFERAFDERHDDPRFGLWCSLALELLGRAALASVSPTLLAEPDPDHKFLLHALNRGSERTARRSISTARVFGLCRTLFDGFSENDRKVSLALVNRRNDELHSGNGAFQEYPAKLWLTGFYRACRSLANAMGESLETLFGDAEAKVALEILKETEIEVRGRVEGSIAAHRRFYEEKSPEDQKAAAENAEKEGLRLASKHHHRAACPACGCTGLVQGESIGPEHVTHDDDGITVRQSVSPRSFDCPACELKLRGYAELEAALLGGQYTRTTEYSPEDYYGLVDANSVDTEKIIEDYLDGLAADSAWDNE